jgi:hypothetical protein
MATAPPLVVALTTMLVEALVAAISAAWVVELAPAASGSYLPSANDAIPTVDSDPLKELRVGNGSIFDWKGDVPCSLPSPGERLVVLKSI